ncbi:MAG: LEA type 2 family protein [Gammaproteobacteria bacterium]|nr:LEA type 2 family protein [Gammaproteobacteria bacterium]MBU1491372.1 LEA type 2 family protein [Gammaproteobacteria bacterium]MBU2064791.1 LEA type 2 family protein [Gammaproteobacteria bacterium]MBU2139337.1 LEA type 2 family protein [Gammaproteobacteria bacterium]MBU2218702.1 LEA type 2 family protein [Gammaproteobacteria bacterium]
MFSQALTIRILSLLLCVGLITSMSGCSTWMSGGFKDPDVRLIKVDVIRAKLLEQQFTLRFRIDNPNAMSLPIRGLDYSVHLNEMKLAEGSSDVWFTVPANGHYVFDVPVRTNLWRHVRQIVKMLEEPDEPISYRLEGAVKTGLMFGRSVHMARNGEIIPGEFLPE